MKLDDYIEGNATVYPSDDREQITFKCQIVCDCGAHVDALDNYCRYCGAAVKSERPVIVQMSWGEVKNFVRPRIEAEYKKRLELREYCNEAPQHN